jgi:hypothetical protein
VYPFDNVSCREVFIDSVNCDFSDSVFPSIEFLSDSNLVFNSSTAALSFPSSLLSAEIVSKISFTDNLGSCFASGVSVTADTHSGPF